MARRNLVFSFQSWLETGPICRSLSKCCALFVLGFLFRLVNAFTATAFFQPDEYFQAWEPAYLEVHGVGFKSWEWQAAIRTSLVPRFFTILIRISQQLKIDHLVLGKIVMAAFAAIADLYTALLAERLLSQRQRPSTILIWLISLGSMFNWYSSTRPFSNTFEMVLVVVGLYYALSSHLSEWLLAQVLAHVSIALRPSNAVLWVFLGVRRLWHSRSWKQLLILGLSSASVGAVTQGSVLALDMHYYGTQVVPYVEFARHNFGSRVSELYGVLPWHWYMSQALPFLLMGYLPMVLLGLRLAPVLALQIVAINIAVFSMIAHKEFRFIYFLLPLLHLIVALGWTASPRPLRIIAVALNVIVAGYLGSVHQRGVVDVIDFVRRSPSVQNVSFLMPCHSTPWHSHFERPLDTEFRPQFLTCDPPWNVSSVGYVDEADRFYLDPKAFLAKYPSKLTSTVVVFEPLQGLMEHLGYSATQSFFNGFFNEDWRRQGRVVLMTKRSNP